MYYPLSLFKNVWQQSNVGFQFSCLEVFTVYSDAVVCVQRAFLQGKRNLRQVQKQAEITQECLEVFTVYIWYFSTSFTSTGTLHCVFAEEFISPSVSDCNFHPFPAHCFNCFNSGYSLYQLHNTFFFLTQIIQIRFMYRLLTLLYQLK